METLRRVTVAGLCLSLALCAMSGCGKKPVERPAQTAVERSAERVDTGKSAPDTSLGRVTVRAGKNATLPENLASDVVVYPRAMISQTVQMPDSDTTLIMLRTTDSFDEVVAFYKERCEAEGWTDTGSTRAPSRTRTAVLTYRKDDRSFSVNLRDNPAEKSRDITLMIGKLQAGVPEAAGAASAVFPSEFRPKEPAREDKNTP